MDAYRSVHRRVPLQVATEERVCGQYVADVTIGCTFGCIYCPFADLAMRRHRVTTSTVADISAASSEAAPEIVYLSGSSDVFTPQAAAHSHELLSRWLEKGTVVGIVTKGIIPDRTLDLLGSYRSQVQGISIGLVSRDDRRNRILEPGCPIASERLALIERVAHRQLPVVLRMDPIFPELDDRVETLEELIVEGKRRGAQGIVAGYVFAWGRYLRNLRREPLVAESVRQLIERTPMAGGMGWSVPLPRKRELYIRLAEIAGAHGLYFQTCGCKDLRLRHGQSFSSRCTENPFISLFTPRVSNCPA